MIAKAKAENVHVHLSSRIPLVIPLEFLKHIHERAQCRCCSLSFVHIKIKPC